MTSGPYLSTAEVAQKLGVSRKALRLYEAQGLIRPERTQSDWRMYRPEQIARLHQILALKSFGFSLSRIGDLLKGRVNDLDGFLLLREQVLRQEVDRLHDAIRLLSEARRKLAAQGHLSSDDLIVLTRKTVMSNTQNEEISAAYQAIAAKHFTTEDQAALDRNGYAGMDKPDPDWPALHVEATRLMQVGDPRSAEAMDLARRWMGKVFEATGGDPALTRKMKEVARETHDHPTFQSASTSSNTMMDFVAAAYGAAIEAGLMPKPQAYPRSFVRWNDTSGKRSET